jgi:hypothetical protein
MGNNQKIEGGSLRRTTPQNIFYHVCLVPLTERHLTNATTKSGKKYYQKPSEKNIPPRSPEKKFPGDFFGNVLKIIPCFRSPLAKKRSKTH